MQPHAYIRSMILMVAIALVFHSAPHANAQIAPPQSGPLSKYHNQKQNFNENTVTIISGQTSGAYLKLAEDLQNVLDQRDTNALRILPIVGTPGPQNIMDVLFLRGVDMCMTETDYFDWFKEKDPELYGNIGQRIHYIAKLFNTELHVVARKDIKSLDDLRGKPVSFYTTMSSADISGRAIFKLLGIDVQAVNFDQPVATDKLKKGEIAAMVRLAGAPITAFSDLKPTDDMHFVPVGPENLPGGFDGNFGKLLKIYLPARLRAEDYPNLIPTDETVPTIASGVVLAAYAWPEGSDRYRRVAKFVNAFFDNFDKFKEKTRHPKWGQTNLATEVPGWTRFKAATDWLNGKRGEPLATSEVSTTPRPTGAAFERFLLENGSTAISPEQREQLRQEYVRWLSKGGANAASR
jgi:uncharacterized protein